MEGDYQDFLIVAENKKLMTPDEHKLLANKDFPLIQSKK